jgi:hypothetical protein
VNNNKKLHRYIWEELNGNIPEGYVIHHIDFDKENNCIDNLQCMTREEHTALHHQHKTLGVEIRKKISNKLRKHEDGVPYKYEYPSCTRYYVYENGKRKSLTKAEFGTTSA